MKEVAATIGTLATSAMMGRILDRSKSVDGIAEKLLEHWEFDLSSRRPGPALLENGTLTPTDLDLICLLSSLVKQGSPLVFNEYHSRRPRTVREGEHLTSTDRRHGRLISIVANKETFSFSARIMDLNVILEKQGEGGADRVGDYRSFMIVDLDGTWHEGWRTIEFVPNRKENEFLTKNRLWTGNRIVFQNFVHPNRWTSFYGQYYLCTKLLIARLGEEASFLRSECKRLLEAGVTVPRLAGDVPPSSRKEKKEGSATMLVQAFECEVDAPWTGEFQPLALTSDALVRATARAKAISYTMNPQLLVPVRATELAFVKNECKERGFPAWIKGAGWESGYVPKGRKNRYERLVLHQNFPGEIGFALRYRVYPKTEQVAESSSTTPP